MSALAYLVGERGSAPSLFVTGIVAVSGSPPDTRRRRWGIMAHTTELTQRLILLREGSPEARERVIEHSCERLRKLTRKMLRGFPGVGRWSETDDVLQAAMLRLHRALVTIQPATPAEFFGLAGVQIRRELLDLAKHFSGAEGLGANHHTDTGSIVSRKQDQPVEPANLEAWSRFHNAVSELDDDEQQVVDLLWYDGMSQPEAAESLKISLATLKRRWATARSKLGKVLADWEGTSRDGNDR